jgi:hypothetical protein
LGVVDDYLELLDSQRESIFTLLDEITDDLLWKPPVPKEWSIGQLLNHNYLLFASTMPYVKLVWNYFHDRGERHRHRPYQTKINDVYREPRFPMWVGFLWKPHYSKRNPVPFDKLIKELRSLHADVRTFYEGKNEDILGNVFVYDPLFGRINLIVTLRIGIYHDQLHFDDIRKMVNKD